jgi:hypothetical protein
MLEQRRLNADGTLRRGRSCTRGKSFRIRLDVQGMRRTRHAAAVRGLAPEALLNSIGRASPATSPMRV